MTEQDHSSIETDENVYQIKDPEELGRNLVKMLESGTHALSLFLEKTGGASGPYSMADEVNQASQTIGNVARAWISDPARFADAQSKLVQGYGELLTRSWQKALGQTVDPIAQPAPGDNRFQDPEWSSNPFFDFWKQAYLLTSDWAKDMVSEAQGVDDRTKKRAEFYTQLIASALSPSNFLFTNPEVLRETLKSNGENLVRGMEQLTKDLENSKDLLKISQTDTSAFEVGKNLAVTPGKIVYQNELIQLIQYAPTTKQVYEIPLLIVPPWINKYYILDLVQKKSFIGWAVDQGFTVFTISWVNPDERLANKTFENYMKDGLLQAIEKVQVATGIKKINTLGYCVGGTLLATTLAYLAATNKHIVNSATFLTTQVDFARAGDLLVFIDDIQLKSLEEMMSEKGYLDSSRMANVFNFLRPRDLIWPYVVNNYLLGKKPFPFDLLYWNQDSTRMPAANHSFYLREFYNDNKLAQKQLVIDNITLDLSKIKIPVYNLATKEDHIAPAKSVFYGSRLFGGLVRFVLAGSGHIAGVINPPDKRKYQYWVNKHKEETLENWMKSAAKHDGSWWPDWNKWLAAKSGEMVAARDPAKGKLKPIEDAPGSYVQVKG